MQTSTRRSSDMSEGTINSNSNDSAIELFDLSPACVGAMKQDKQCRSVSSYLTMMRLKPPHKSRKFRSLQAAPRDRGVDGPRRAYSLDLVAQHRSPSQQHHTSTPRLFKRLTLESSLDNLSFISGPSRQNEHTVPDTRLLDPHYRRASTLRVSAPTTAVSEHFPLDGLLRAVNDRLSKGISVISDPKSPLRRGRRGNADRIFEEAFDNAVVCLSSRNSPSSSAGRVEEKTLTSGVDRGRTLTKLRSFTRECSRGQASRRPSLSWSLLADCGSPPAQLSELDLASSTPFTVSYQADTSRGNSITSQRGPGVDSTSRELSPSASPSLDGCKAGTDSRTTSSSSSIDSESSNDAVEGSRHATPSQLIADEEVGCVLEELCDLDERPLGHARYIELDVSPSSAATASSGYGSDEAPVITLKLRTRSNTLETSETPKRALPPIGPPPTADLPALPASAGNTKSYSISPVGRPPARSRSVTDMLSRRDSPVIGPRRRATEDRRSPPESKSAYFASACKEQQRPSSSAEQHFPRMATTPTGLPCPPRPPRDPRRPSTGAEGAERPRLLSSACSIRSDTPMSASVTQALKHRLPACASSQAGVGATAALRVVAGPRFYGHEPSNDTPMAPKEAAQQLARDQEANTAAVHLWRDKVLAPAPAVDATQRAHKIGRGILDRVQNLVALKTATVAQGSACERHATTQQHLERWSPVSERTAMPLLRGRSLSEGEQGGQPAPAPFETRLLSRAGTSKTAKITCRPATAGRSQEASERGPPSWGVERETPIAAAHRIQKALPRRPFTSHGERNISSTARGAVTPPRVVDPQRQVMDVTPHHSRCLSGAGASSIHPPPFLATIPTTRTRSIKKEKSVPENLRSALGRGGSGSKESIALPHLVRVKSSSTGSGSAHGPSCLTSASSSWSSLSTRRLTE